ncbi:SRPBCC family protein [Cylindrospermum sp. FACHB-282]|uniref:SRPBCC family protein n=1 Tax=Cylindrospermum sp. FACHB-282 TaxID=2692794 RepID=UPI001687C7F0|nr:SRPBCC family protein [Cylindrospermum sp. FACHB-282]MBD2384086.1 SRPBCC family protein [Cylindrospermum sp. FACHB-282]
MTKQQNTIKGLDSNSPSDHTNLEITSSANPAAVITTDVAIQVEKISERQRQIKATVQIPQPVEKIWNILTDYEALVEFIPNLAKSRLLEHPQGGIRLEQIGSQSLLNFKFCARVVLDLEELFPKAINFQMVEGDFKGFSGSWCLEPYSLGAAQGTNLCYTIQVWPKLTMPISIIENRLSKDLRLNLLAIRQRVEALPS